LVKDSIKSLVVGSGIPRVIQAAAQPRVLILRYHSVREDPAKMDAFISTDITHSVPEFRKQMEYIARTCKLVTLDEIPDMASGAKPIPRRGVAITFDDGFLDNYEIAAPILEENGLRGTFYLATSATDGRPLWFVRMRYWTKQAKIERPQFLEASAHCATSIEPDREKFMATLDGANTLKESFCMTWDHARDLIKRGHIIGSHTVNHPNMAKVPSEEVKREFEESKKRLEGQLGKPIQHFCYPNPILSPNWNTQTVDASRNAGYKTGVTSNSGFLLRGTDTLSLPRHFVAGTFQQFVWDLEMGFCGRRP
jgi:peptidoglycan/xylan/chitin deacetylase (PgdA/CDA1 family)